MQNEKSSLGEGLHLAIIMDGNGRWAKRRGLPRTAGHRQGAKAVRRAVEAAGDFGVETLTLYAFSSDNWQRPAEEVATLMQLFERYLGSETERCIKHGVRLNVIGRRDRLSSRLVRAIEKAEAATVGGSALHLRLAVDYSSRHAIATAASMFAIACLLSVSLGHSSTRAASGNCASFAFSISDGVTVAPITMPSVFSSALTMFSLHEP